MQIQRVRVGGLMHTTTRDDGVAEARQAAGAMVQVRNLEYKVWGGEVVWRWSSSLNLATMIAAVRAGANSQRCG
ncbi:hypothetical protein C1H46_013620 [Malus baccata]|uniref:Uncharacterized protein n=1 Tax=Malus baccata TaxID=106549 RepID=A0A540MPX9_MALBA|nr:hypothetical protein C1H46_013620 [Malus baccata]